jgi:hypothetical protein
MNYGFDLSERSQCENGSRAATTKMAKSIKKYLPHALIPLAIKHAAQHNATLILTLTSISI